jgi:hypothetical protein
MMTGMRSRPLASKTHIVIRASLRVTAVKRGEPDRAYSQPCVSSPSIR